MEAFRAEVTITLVWMVFSFFEHHPTMSGHIVQWDGMEFVALLCRCCLHLRNFEGAILHERCIHL